MEFAEFYMNGGFFMNIITVIGAVAAGALVRGAFERYLARARGVAVAPSGLVPRLCAVLVLVGVLAFADGCAQTFAALRTVPKAQWIEASARAGEIVMIPFGWALAIAATLLFVDALLVSRRAPSAC